MAEYTSVDNELGDELYEHYRFEASKGQSALRVDKFLMNLIENTTRSKIQNAIETETKAIFNQISELIDHKYTQKKVNGVEIDFKLLDQRIADKFTNYQQVLIKVCEHSQLKKYFRSYLKECFKHFKIICEQEYQEWQKKNPDHAKADRNAETGSSLQKSVFPFSE